MAGAELALAPPRERRDRARIAGVDEAGRGPLAGPVVAAAVILDPRRRIRGGGLLAAVSAASILAKVHRDAMMRALDARYPAFALARHKGYGTPAHLEALARRPPSPLHRRSFSPLRRSGDT